MLTGLPGTGRTWTRPLALLVALLAAGLLACSDDSSNDSGPDPDLSVLDGPTGQEAAVDASPDGSPGRFDPQIEQKLQKVLEDYHQKHGPPGAILAAQLDQAKRWSGAVGKSDLAAGTAASADQLFRIASITKVFTATLVLLLEQDNKLSVEDHLDKYIPTSVVPNGDKIPLYRLLNHTSGVADFGKLPEAWTKPHTPQELVDMAVKLGPSFPPGEKDKWEYSNTNYLLLGLVIEKTTGKKLHEVLRERILKPHNLSRTFLEDYESVKDPEVKGHALVGGKITDVTERDSQVTWTAGGMISNATDTAAFFDLLHAGSILSAASLKKMREQYNVDLPKPWDPSLPADLTSIKYGLGLFEMMIGSDTYYGHPGNLIGFQSLVSHRPRDRVTVAAFVNAQETPAFDLCFPAYTAFP